MPSKTKPNGQTTDQVAADLQISRRRVLALIAAGRIKAQKHGRDWLITDTTGAAVRKNGRPRKSKD